MHVLIVTPWYPAPIYPVGGVFVQDQARVLLRRGIQVGVLHSDRISVRDLGDPRARSGLRQRSIEYHDGHRLPVERAVGFNWFPRVPYGQSALWLRSARKLYRRYVSDYGTPDLIHAHCGIYSAVFAAEIRETDGVPYVLTEHSTVFARGLIRDWQRPMLRRAYRHASQRFFVGPSLAADVRRVIGADVIEPFSELPNVVDYPFLSAPLRPASGPGFSFFSLALWTAKKDGPSLIRAFARAFKGDDSVRLRIGGSGEDLGEMKDLARDLGSRVEFIGELDRAQVLEEMRSCDAFVSSSRVETFGVVLIEALACGKPVVATRSGGPESFVTPEDGILVPSGDVDALASGMSEMARSRGRYDDARIRQRCAERFGEQVIGQRLIEAYAKAIDDLLR